MRFFVVGAALAVETFAAGALAPAAVGVLFTAVEPPPKSGARLVSISLLGPVVAAAADSFEAFFFEFVVAADENSKSISWSSA